MNQASHDYNPRLATQCLQGKLETSIGSSWPLPQVPAPRHVSLRSGFFNFVRVDELD